jgi:hypothetical protein
LPVAIPEYTMKVSSEISRLAKSLKSAGWPTYKSDSAAGEGVYRSLIRDMKRRVGAEPLYWAVTKWNSRYGNSVIVLIGDKGGNPFVWAVEDTRREGPLLSPREYFAMPAQPRKLASVVSNALKRFGYSSRNLQGWYDTKANRVEWSAIPMSFLVASGEAASMDLVDTVVEAGEKRGLTLVKKEKGKRKRAIMAYKVSLAAGGAGDLQRARLTRGTGTHIELYFPLKGEAIRLTKPILSVSMPAYKGETSDPDEAITAAMHAADNTMSVVADAYRAFASDTQEQDRLVEALREVDGNPLNLMYGSSFKSKVYAPRSAPPKMKEALSSAHIAYYLKDSDPMVQALVERSLT